MKKTQVWGGRMKAPPEEANVRFCAGRDVQSLPMADEVLFEYDLWTNLAHSRMLQKIGVLNKEELIDIQEALLNLQLLQAQGKFKLNPDKEDVHINIEHELTQTYGVKAGLKIHSGRSRNDQVSTDMRLFMRDQVISLIQSLSEFVLGIHELAKGETKTIMPGFTHYQPAMFTTAAHWLTSWSQGLCRDIERLLDDLSILNRSPLGSAASFGTTWPIDRKMTAELLGFDAVDENSLDCICSRGENEARIASTVSIMMNRLSMIAQDILLLSTPYYNMIEIDDRFVTGSSIMPQKRNMDFAELIRSKAAQSHGILMGLLGIQKGSMSGYNRDTQQTKYLIMDLFRECLEAPVVLTQVMTGLSFNKKGIQSQIKKGYMNSADMADWLAQKFSLPFRDCYDILSKTVGLSEAEGELNLNALNQALKEGNYSITISKEEFNQVMDPKECVNRKHHIGSPSSKSVTSMIRSQAKSIKEFQQSLKKIDIKIIQAKTKCFSHS